jgi:hypothetical protein
MWTIKMIRTRKATVFLAAATASYDWRRSPMKKLLASLTLALSLGIGAIIGSAPAAADEVSYLTAIAQLGITANDGNYVTLLRWGYAVCADKSEWIPLDTTVNNLVWAPQNNLTYPQVSAMAIAANTYLC